MNNTFAFNYACLSTTMCHRDNSNRGEERMRSRGEEDRRRRGEEEERKGEVSVWRVEQRRRGQCLERRAEEKRSVPGE